ncbi:hypothetical protein JCM11491_000628 [Sporobolomyces phaffii]
MLSIAHQSPVTFNYVGALHEWSQRSRRVELQDSYSSVGMDHSRVWTCRLTVIGSTGDKTFEALGMTKKEAKNLAARNACVALGLVELSSHS